MATVTRTRTLKEFVVDLESLGPVLINALKEAFQKGGDDTLRWSKIFCPFKTGALMTSGRITKVQMDESRGTITITFGGGGVINPDTGKEVDYELHVHEGTAKQRSQPWLQQTALVMAQPIGNRIIELTAGRIP